MIDLHFEMNGRRTKASKIVNELERALVESIAQDLRDQLSSVRDPDTGEFPTVVIRGSSLDNMSVAVEGSDAVIALAKALLDSDFERIESEPMIESSDDPPSVFLCHGSEDKVLVERLARDLTANGIDVFFDQWCIEPGDSIRQRIDQGLMECSHFVVVLSSTSISKPWVNAEIDAGFVKNLDGQCHFVPLRYKLEAHELPPLLAGMLSPALDDYEIDVRELIGYFFGITKKPALGVPPDIVRRDNSEMGVSPAARRLVDMFMAGTVYGLHMDPQISSEELRSNAQLTDDEIEDAVCELDRKNLVNRHSSINSGSLGFVRVVPTAALFVEFDRFYCDWNPELDGLRVATELLNQDQDAENCERLAERLAWPARRMNPAITYLQERNLVDSNEELSTHPWCTSWVRRNSATRRFVNSRM